MTGGEISWIQDVIRLSFEKAKFDYEVYSHDYGEDHILTTIAKSDLEKLEKAKQIIDRTWDDYLETLEVIDLDAG
jgi:hypothetical protein